MSPDTHPQLSLKLPVWRTRLVLVCLVLAFAGLAVRAGVLQGNQSRLDVRQRCHSSGEDDVAAQATDMAQVGQVGHLS